MDTAMMTHFGGLWKMRRPTVRYTTSYKISPISGGKNRMRHHPKTSCEVNMRQEPFSAKFVRKPSTIATVGAGSPRTEKSETESVMKVRFALSPVELPTFYPVRENPKSNKCLYATLVCPTPSKFKAKFINKEDESVSSSSPQVDVISEDGGIIDSSSIKTLESESDFVPIERALQRAEHHISQCSFDEKSESFPDVSTPSQSMDSALDQLLHNYPQVVEAAFRSLADKHCSKHRRTVADKKKAKACAGKMSLVKPAGRMSRRDREPDGGRQFKVRVKLLRKICKVYTRQAKPKNRLMSTIRVPTPEKRARQARHPVRNIVSQDKALEQEDLAPLKLAKSMPSLGQKRNSSSEESLISDVTTNKLRRVASLSTDLSRNDSSVTTSSTSTTMPKNGSISPSSTSCSAPSASAGLLSDSELMDVKRCSSPSRLLWM